MRLFGAFRQADDHAVGLGIPIGGEHSSESGNEIDAACICDLLCHPFRIGHGTEQSKGLLEPSKGQARYENASFQSIGHFIPNAPCNGCNESVVGIGKILPHIHQEKGAFSIGVLCHAGFKAGFAEKIRLLVANASGDGDWHIGELGIRHSIEMSGWIDRR